MKHTKTCCKLICALLCAAMLLPLSACGETKESQREIFAMDTVMTLTAYGNNREAGLDAAQSVIHSMDSILDPELDTSITYAINNAQGANVSITAQVANMLATAKDPNGGSEEAMSHATAVLENDPNMQEILEAGMWGFGTSIHLSQPHIDPRTNRVVVGPDPERRSGMLMNNLMLRAIAPEITDRVARQRAVYAASRGGNYAGDQAAKNHFADLISEAQSSGVGRDELNASIAFQKAVKEGAGQTQQGSSFRNLMARIFRRRRGY